MCNLEHTYDYILEKDSYTFNLPYFLQKIEMFYLNSALNFGIPPVLVFQLEVYYKVDRLLTGLTAQQKRTTALWYSIKTSLFSILKGLYIMAIAKKVTFHFLIC